MCLVGWTSIFEFEIGKVFFCFNWTVEETEPCRMKAQEWDVVHAQISGRGQDFVWYYYGVVRILSILNSLRILCVFRPYATLRSVGFTNDQLRFAWRAMCLP
jgi:hypothetical protein